MHPAIVVENLGKSYCVQHENVRRGYRTLRESLISVAAKPINRVHSLFTSGPSSQKSSSEEFWALKDVSFEVQPGEVVGIIGRNGAGKSTLLKILSRITKPTHGRVVLNGRVGSLLEVGTGFHPELTGRENIFLNGSVLGMSKSSIERKFDEIVDFAEIEQFLDTPVKRYSSGMYVRLAFAVAAHLEPEILLVDEVLAVGDAEFQRKCLGKMEDVADEGRTVIFVSHNLQTTERLCRRGILMQKGGIVCDDTAQRVCQEYLAGFSRLRALDLNSSTDRKGDGRARFSKLEVIDPETRLPTEQILSGDSFIIRLHFVLNEVLIQPHIGFALLTTTGTRVFNTVYSDCGSDISRLAKSGFVDLHVDGVNLAIGTYMCNAAFSDRTNHYCDYVVGVPCFEVVQGGSLPNSRIYDQSNGVIYPDVSWRLQIGSASPSESGLLDHEPATKLM